MTGLTPQDRAVLNVAVLTWMQKQLKTGVDEARALADGLMKKGDTISARSPIDDTKIA